jgi:hypothetical protein
MAKASQVIVLAEDQRQPSFVRRFLHRLGYDNHHIRLSPLPARGSGEQWVREHYAQEVQANRARSASARTKLVVVIDADKAETAKRLEQLGEALAAAGISQRSGAEAIALFIPKRAIETWILCLNGENVDEETDYRKRSDLDVRNAAHTFYAWTRPQAIVPPMCLPSLKIGIEESQRLF